jgi:hypothetical protein
MFYNSLRKKMLKSIATYLVIIFAMMLISYNALISETKKEVESLIERSLLKLYPNSDPKVKVLSTNNDFKGSQIILDKLSIRLNGISFGNIQSDFFTAIYESAKIDFNILKSKNSLNIISNKNMDVRIGVSPSKMERSMQIKMKGMGKKNIKADFKYAPPFVECTYNIPESQLGKDTKAMLVKYIAGSSLEGYLAFKLSAKKNQVYADPSKVILNHFLLPGALVKNFKDVYNPFEALNTIKPFKYSINKCEVQDKFIIFTN